ncbi:MAG: mannonate dehydratase, partial [Clostridia bacterium]|nr:mannonate dehydratase [Clostridia bacterium]
AVNTVKSYNLGVTMCQATYQMMGEDLYKVIPELKDKIFFIHFRNAVGNKYKFNETFHDNGAIDMADMLRLYKKCGINVPIRVDHVPLMAGEKQETAGYTALGRLYAIGYLKGLLEACE